MKRICLGKIVAAHGVKGLVKIRPFGDDPSLMNGTIYTNESGKDTLHITLKNGLGKYILAEVKDVQDRTQAEEIRGTELYVDREILPDLDEGHYFEDLIGMSVVDKTSAAIGKVITADNFGGGDLIEIRGPKGTFMLPFIEDYASVQDDQVVIKDFEQFL